MGRYGLPGKARLLRGICELAEAGALRKEGLVGIAVQAIILMEHAGEGSDDRLVEFLAARAVGRKKLILPLPCHQCQYNSGFD